MATTTQPDTAVQVANVIRDAAVWWKLAAEQLEAGDHDQAAQFAKVGRFGVEGMVERIEALG